MDKRDKFLKEIILVIIGKRKEEVKVRKASVVLFLVSLLTPLLFDITDCSAFTPTINNSEMKVNDITVRWDIQDTYGYEVQRCTGTCLLATDFTKVAVVYPNTGCVPHWNSTDSSETCRCYYKDTGLTASTTYKYKIIALKSPGCPNGITSLTVSGTTTSCTDPTGPTPWPIDEVIDPGLVNLNSVKLKWVDVDDEVGYKVQRCVWMSCDYTDVAMLPANTTTYTDTGPSANTSYLYKITALAANGCSDQSGLPAILTTKSCTDATKGLSVPAAPTFSNVTTESMKVTWEIRDNGETYELQTCRVPTGETTCTNFERAVYTPQVLKSLSDDTSAWITVWPDDISATHRFRVIAKATGCSNNTGAASEVTLRIPPPTVTGAQCINFPDGGFETGTLGDYDFYNNNEWKGSIQEVGATYDEKHSGAYSAELRGNSPLRGGDISKHIGDVGNFTIKFWYKTSYSSSSKFSLKIGDNLISSSPATYVIPVSNASSQGWVEGSYTYTGTTSANTKVMFSHYDNDNSANKVWIDDVSLCKAGATAAEMDEILKQLMVVSTGARICSVVDNYFNDYFKNNCGNCNKDDVEAIITESARLAAELLIFKGMSSIKIYKGKTILEGFGWLDKYIGTIAQGKKVNGIFVGTRGTGLYSILAESPVWGSVLREGLWGGGLWGLPTEVIQACGDGFNLPSCNVIGIFKNVIFDGAVMGLYGLSKEIAGRPLAAWMMGIMGTKKDSAKGRMISAFAYTLMYTGVTVGFLDMVPHTNSGVVDWFRLRIERIGAAAISDDTRFLLRWQNVDMLPDAAPWWDKVTKEYYLMGIKVYTKDTTVNGERIFTDISWEEYNDNSDVFANNYPNVNNTTAYAEALLYADGPNFPLMDSMAHPNCPNQPGTPAAPTLNDNLLTYSKSVTIGWQAVPNAAGYLIQYCQGQTCTPFASSPHDNVAVVEVTDISKTSYTYTDCDTEYSTYQYRIVALGAPGCKNQPGPWKAITVGDHKEICKK